jgi:hypothetical protein
LLTITKSFNTKLRTTDPPPETANDNQAEDNSRPNAGYFSWLPELYNISATEVRKCCGLEAYLYLMFVRGSAQFFAFVSVISVGTLVPTYTYGEQADEK